MKSLPIILVGILYFANYWILLELYPKAESDYYQYVDFVSARDKIYEVMFTGLFFALFINTKGLGKAVACFFLILATSSLIDKAGFNIFRFLKSDAIMITISLLLSISVYVRQSKVSPK